MLNYVMPVLAGRTGIHSSEETRINAFKPIDDVRAVACNSQPIVQTEGPLKCKALTTVKCPISPKVEIRLGGQLP